MTRLIDADAFKKQLEESYEYTELSEVIEMLDNAQTVENDFHRGYAQGYVDGRTSTESLEGTWIYKDYNYTCSNCGKNALESDDYPFLSSYCPFCGAEMEIEQ